MALNILNILCIGGILYFSYNTGKLTPPNYTYPAATAAKPAKLKAGP